MGILYETVKLSQESKRQILIQDLLALGVTESKDGKDITKMDYYELRSHLEIYHLKKE